MVPWVGLQRVIVVFPDHTHLLFDAKPIGNPDGLFVKIANEPWHGISNNVVCATSKASDQPAHTRSLIRAFASRLNILWVLSRRLNIIWSF